MPPPRWEYTAELFMGVGSGQYSTYKITSKPHQKAILESVTACFFGKLASRDPVP